MHAMYKSDKHNLFFSLVLLAIVLEAGRDNYIDTNYHYNVVIGIS